MNQSLFHRIIVTFSHMIKCTKCKIVGMMSYNEIYTLLGVFLLAKPKVLPSYHENFCLIP